jgi:hypothetical protein
VSFGAGQSKAPKSRTPMGYSATRGSSHEVGVPVPVLFGTGRIGLHQICPPFKRFTRPIKGSSKKGGGKRPANNYATLVLGLGEGVVTCLRELWVDDERWYLGPLVRGIGEIWAPITVEGLGSGKIYWGTMDQTCPAALLAEYPDHSDLKGYAFLIFEGAVLGANKDQVPNIEAVFSRCEVYPVTVNSNFYHTYLAPVLELGMDKRFGLGVEAGLIDYAGMATLESVFLTEGNPISPFVTSATSFRQFLADYGNEHGIVFRPNKLGQLTGKAIRQTSGSFPTYSDADFLAPPVLSPGSWEGVPSAVQVGFLNKDNFWQSDVTIGVDGGASGVTRSSQMVVEDHPWIIDPEVAARSAKVRSQRLGRPWNSLTLVVRQSRIGALEGPGDLIRYSYARWNVAGQLVRVTRMEIGEPGDPRVTLECSYDTGVLNVTPYVPGTYTPGTLAPLVPVVATYQEVWQLPSALGGSEVFPAVGLLCAQPSPETDGFYGHILAGGSYQPLVPSISNGFALRGTVRTAMGATGSPLDMDMLGSELTFGRYSTGDFALGKVYAKVGDEVMVVTGATLAFGGWYQLSVLRAALGTAGAAHSVSDPVWVFHLDDVYQYDVETASTFTVTATFRIQPAIRGVGVSLASCAPLTITVDPADLKPFPLLFFYASGSAFLEVWNTGIDVTLTWTASAARETRIEVWDPLGPTLMTTLNFAAGVTSFVWPFATASAATAAVLTLGYVEFRAFHRTNGKDGSASVSRLQKTF